MRPGQTSWVNIIYLFLEIHGTFRDVSETHSEVREGRKEQQVEGRK